MSLKGFGVDFEASGAVLPKAKLDVRARLDIEPVAKALEDLALTLKAMDVSGVMALEGTLRGALGSEQLLGRLSTQSLGLGAKKISNLELSLEGSLKDLRKLRLDFGLKNARVHVEAEHVFSEKNGRFVLKTDHFLFEQFEDWLKPSGSPTLMGPLDIEAKGRIRALTNQKLALHSGEVPRPDGHFPAYRAPRSALPELFSLVSRTVHANRDCFPNPL